MFKAPEAIVLETAFPKMFSKVNAEGHALGLQEELTAYAQQVPGLYTVWTAQRVARGVDIKLGHVFVDLKADFGGKG